jgi:ectoine hydroxylase-related dioxygenase (phytanoyl-CoA dioxygenase family)
MAELSTHPAIIRVVADALGPDVLLWGSQIIMQSPRQRHRWHIDVEHATWNGVTVWLAIRNVVPQESFSIITRSHRFNVTPQELAAQQGIDLLDDEAVYQAARQLDPQCEQVRLDIADGQFFIFKGKLWHGTRNNTNADRLAVILQYTTPDNQVRIPLTFDYPNIAWSANRPTCLLVKGRDAFGVNSVLQPEQITGA